MLGAEEDAPHIDGHQRVPICHTGCQDGTAHAVAGIGDDNVDPTEAFRCLGCLRDHGGLAGDISDRRQAADAGGDRFSRPDAATAPVIIAVLSLKRILRLPLRFAETILQKLLQSVDTFVLNLGRHLEAKVNNTPSLEERPEIHRKMLMVRDLEGRWTGSTIAPRKRRGIARQSISSRASAMYRRCKHLP